MSTELLTTAVDCFWLFFGGVLVFFMQTGFTMVEAGFTRSKNTGNIIMKNIVDFMFGSIIYWFIGYGLMYGEGNGFIGIPFGTEVLSITLIYFRKLRLKWLYVQYRLKML